MEKTRNSVIDLFKNFGLAISKLVNDGEVDDVELTGELAKDPMEALKEYEASVKSVKATKSKSVTVSATVKVNGVTYKVTTVNAKAFAKATKATKITLPASIKTINKSAFTGAKKVVDDDEREM